MVDAGRALAEALDRGVDFEPNPLRKGKVIEQSDAATELRAVDLDQASAARSRRLQRRGEACGESLHGSRPYARRSNAHPQSDIFASRIAQTKMSLTNGTSLVRPVRRRYQLCFVLRIETMHMIRKGQLEHPKGQVASAARQFYSLAF